MKRSFDLHPAPIAASFGHAANAEAQSRIAQNRHNLLGCKSLSGYPDTLLPSSETNIPLDQFRGIRSPARVIVAFAAQTGMRRGEILNLKWQDVDLEQGMIFVRNTKNCRVMHRWR